MSPAAVSTVSSSSRVQVPRLRSSCDGCGNAKVRCNRERPQCSRCSALKIDCSYGRCNRSGKPSRKSLASYTPARTETRLRTLNDTTQLSGKASSSYTEDSRDTSISDHRPNSTTAHAVSSSSSSGNITPPAAGTQHQQLPSTFYHPVSFNEWPQLPLWDSLQPALFQPTYLPGSLLQPTTPSIPSQAPHSCPRESYEIFRDLICPTPFLHAPELNSITVSAQLDQVLQFCRNAVERLSQVLRCPCARTGHRAMVHASIVSRILIWYQQAAGWTGSSEWGSQPLSMGSSSTMSPSSRSPSIDHNGMDGRSGTTLVQATGFDVEHVPISVGAFNIEDQNVQGAFRNQLVLSELKKITALIELFISQGDGGDGVDGCTGLYSQLGMWLRDEHGRIVDILKSRLRVLSQGSDT